jgi:hypothetical protein
LTRGALITSSGLLLPLRQVSSEVSGSSDFTFLFVSTSSGLDSRVRFPTAGFFESDRAADAAPSKCIFLPVDAFKAEAEVTSPLEAGIVLTRAIAVSPRCLRFSATFSTGVEVANPREAQTLPLKK